jgi:hypothetical protein
MKMKANLDFVEFSRRLMAVPHSEIKEKLDAEKQAKRMKAKPKRHASRVFASPSKAR